jgi:serine-type D-Ala-D-Ala carboxypeptidase/endopeptidase (penicillin-binding protein 4)
MSAKTSLPAGRGRSLAAIGVGVTLVASGVLPATAQAAPARVPVWPTIGSALPAGMSRPAIMSTDAFRAKMRTRLDKRVHAAALGGSVSVRVEDLESGTAEFSYRSKVGRTPASNEKAATALAVLSAQGAHHLMPTKVYRSSDETTLTIVGGGDPLLSSSNLDQLANDTVEALTETGLPSEPMTLVFDDSLFAPATSPPGWYSSYYSTYATRPAALTRDLRRVGDSGADASRYFRSRLKQYGLPVAKGVTRTKLAADAQPLSQYNGHTIAGALWPMLQDSDNSIAENMIRHVALARGYPTTAQGSAGAVAHELNTLGVPMANAHLVDGSGLSGQDRLSARTLAGIVRASMDPDHPDLATGYRTAAFPTAGVSGTLSSRFHAGNTKCAIRRVMAKTGTLSNVVALTGVAASDDGRHRAFSVLVNNKPSRWSLDSTRYAVDRIVTAVTGCH